MNDEHHDTHASPPDAPEMAEVLMRSWEEAYGDIIPEDFIRQKNAARPEQFRQAITDGNEDEYVIQESGRIIGIMKVAPPLDDDLGGDYYELRYLYLHPDYFRRGVGKRAMAFAFDKARQFDRQYMSVWLFAENKNAADFYIKCGFAPDGKTQTKDCGRPMECIRMIKNLLE